MAEVKIWAGSPSQSKNFWTYTWCLIFSWLILPIFYAIWVYIKTNSVKYEISSERIITSNGVFTRITDEVSLYKVIDFEIREPFWYRIFGLSILVLNVAADMTNSLIILDGVKNGRQLKDEIRKNLPVATGLNSVYIQS